MKELEPKASLRYHPGRLDEALAFLKRAWEELRVLRCVRVWQDRFRVYDINGDCFEIEGVGYPDADIMPLLDAVYAAYRPDSIHEPFAGPYKEYRTGRRYPWARDRVM